MNSTRLQLNILGIFHLFNGIITGLMIPFVISVYTKDVAGITQSAHPFASYANLQAVTPILKVWLGLLCLFCVGNIFSGIYLFLRRRRGFSFGMAVVNLLAPPFGSVVAIFTILALRRPATCALYQDKL